VPPAGNEIFAHREYYKLVPRETLLKGYVYDRVLQEFRDRTRCNSGEIRITVNDRPAAGIAAAGD